jgi:membrane protein DedA with SNARE-associated domain
MEPLLIKYGYALLFLGVAFEGEAVLLAAALLAHRGLFRLPVVIAVAVAANSLADQAYFQLARLRGRRWLEKRFGDHPRYRRIIDLVGRRGGPMLAASRFAYGLRIAIPAACGALGMGVLRFTVLDLAAGVLWAAPMAGLGYFAGIALGPLLDGVRRYEKAAALVLLAAAAMVLAARHVRRAVRWLELQRADHGAAGLRRPVLRS